MEKNIAREQHMLVKVVHHRELLATLNLSGRHVLEFGVGTGVLTKLVLERDPEAVIGYEIDPSLCPLRDSRLTLHEGDLTQAPFSYLAGSGKYCIIANPPYECLKFIRELLDTYRIPDAILMVPPKRREWFLDFEEAFRLQGEDFEPASKGEHLVLRRGFR